MKRLLTIFIMCIAMLTGCSYVSDDVRVEDEPVMSEKDAKAEMSVLLNKIKVTEVQDPQMYIYSDEIDEAAALADIDTYPIVVSGKGSINVEIAGATELTSDAPDDWLNIVAKNFNSANMTYNGKSVCVSIRQITSGEILTYITMGDYKPGAIIPSSDAWGNMISASGFQVNMLTDRLIGNTAGFLLSQDAYATMIEKYQEVNMSTIVQAVQNRDIIFGTVNPIHPLPGLTVLA